jgi:peptidoglycan hydrolase-like protein with peptidoglycan-binding domain
MSTAASSRSVLRSRLRAAGAALGCAAAMLTASAIPAAPASEMADAAAVAPDDQEEPDGPELDEAQLGDLVADAQRRLRLSGYDPGPIDGQLGLRTQRAIRAYQAVARRNGTLEALKGPPPGNAAARPELVGSGQRAPAPTQ